MSNQQNPSIVFKEVIGMSEPDFCWSGHSMFKKEGRVQDPVDDTGVREGVAKPCVPGPSFERCCHLITAIHSYSLWINCS